VFGEWDSGRNLTVGKTVVSERITCNQTDADSPHIRHGFSEEESLRITELVMNYFESVVDDNTQRII
jgi:hypothetical protein